MIWLWWLGACLVLGVIEALAANMTFLMLAGGALGGTVAAAGGAPFWAQALVFVTGSVLLLSVVRPRIGRRPGAAAPALTRAETLIGCEAVVLTTVDARGGRVHLDGEKWCARLAEHAGARALRLDAGRPVRVTDVDGAVAVVEPR